MKHRADIIRVDEELAIPQYKRVKIMFLLYLLEKGTVDVSGMPTHRFSFADSKAAFDLVASYGDGVMKAMIDF